MSPRDIPIPPRMRHLPIDPRGYPVPCMTAIGPDGRARFAVNDERKRQRVIRLDLCSICGGKLNKSRWFVGGPQSAFHEHGAYIDPPLHGECMRYALMVCPYLALPGYSEITSVAKLADKLSMPLIESTMLTGRPQLFVAVRSAGTILYLFEENPKLVRTLAPAPPYQRVEYWRHGEHLSQDIGRKLTAAAMSEPLPELMLPRIVFPAQ